MLAGSVVLVPGLDLDFDTRQCFLRSGCLLCMPRRWDCFRFGLLITGVPVSFSFGLIHHPQVAGWSGESPLSFYRGEPGARCVVDLLSPMS